MPDVRRLLARLPILLSLALPLCAQDNDPARLTVERFTRGEFAARPFGPVRWLDGAHYTTLEPNRERNALELVRYDARSNARDVLITASDLHPEGRDRALIIEDYQPSPDGKHWLVFCDSERVWRQNTRGEYHVVTPGQGSKRLGGDLPKSTLMFAKFSPDGTRVAYVAHNDLFVEDWFSGTRVQLTTDGSRTVINGTFDWVYEEEFDCRDGFRWSPDGTRIAFWQLDCSGVGEFLMIDNLSGLYPRTVPVQYPLAGTTNSSCRIGVIDAQGGATVWLKTEGDPRNTYLPRMEWHPSGRELMVQWLPRHQNHLKVLAADAASGAIRTVHEEHDEAYIDVRDDFRWLQDGKSFFWTSDVDGWRHAWALPWGKGEAALLTSGPHDVMSVDYADVDRGLLYVSTTPNPTQRYLMTVPSGGGEPQPIAAASPKSAPGTHQYEISTDGSLAIHTFSAFDTPPVIDLVTLPAHERVRMLVDNRALHARNDALDKGRNEMFRVTTSEGIEIDGWAMYPKDFDPAKKWPVVFHVYNEPWAQTVLDSWAVPHHLFHRWLTQQGYVVMSLDARGTPAPRGRAWRKALFQNIGIKSSHDWSLAVDALCAQHDWMDRARLSIWGWSGGGAMTLNMLFRYPGLFRAGMAVAPVSDIRLYDSIYQERYCGLPDEVPDVYRTCSPINFAKDLKDQLLLVHGTGDDNVHYQNSERLVDELIAQGKQFEFFAYPNRTHAIVEGRNTRTHLYSLLGDFLMRRVPAGPR
ncbi:MAG: DPP IV N-terminal domain-containing protein [Planctomycetota bacterium]